MPTFVPTPEAARQARLAREFKPIFTDMRAAHLFSHDADIYYRVAASECSTLRATAGNGFFTLYYAHMMLLGFSRSMNDGRCVRRLIGCHYTRIHSARLNCHKLSSAAPAFCFCHIYNTVCNMRHNKLLITAFFFARLPTRTASWPLAKRYSNTQNNRD